MEETEKKDYEISFLGKNEDVAREVLKLVKQHQMDVVLESSPRKINLAYPIDHETEAYFGSFYVHSLPLAAKDFERDLKANQKVMRFLIVKPPFHKEEKPGAIPPRGETIGEAAAEQPSAPRAHRQERTELSNEALEKKIEEILQ